MEVAPAEAHAAAYELAYVEGKDAVAAQQTAIENFRGRAGLLLSGAAISTSFLGGQALRSGTLKPWSWVAIVLFALLGAGALTVLWPRGWKFQADPRDIIATYIETDDPASLPVIHRDLALHRANVLEENGRRLKRLIWVFRLAGVMLLCEMVAWAADLATRVP